MDTNNLIMIIGLCSILGPLAYLVYQMSNNNDHKDKKS